MKRSPKYTAKRRNINAEKRRVLALIHTHLRGVEDANGYADTRAKVLRFLASEIVRDAHRGRP